MTVRLKNGAVATVNESYGARLLGQGAVLLKGERSEPGARSHARETPDGSCGPYGAEAEPERVKTRRVRANAVRANTPILAAGIEPDKAGDEDGAERADL